MYDLNLKISAVLKDLISSAGLSELELAKQMSIPHTTLNHIKNGSISNPSAITLKKIADYFDLTLEQVMGFAPIERNFAKNLIAVPLLTQQNVLDKFNNVHELNHANYSSWIRVEVEPVFENHKIFALKVVGDGMWPVFDDETIIIVDIDLKAENRSFVLVSLMETKEVLFRKLLIEGNTYILAPINKSFSQIKMKEYDYLIGSVIAAVKDFTSP